MWHNVSMNGSEDIEPGIQRIVLDTREIYPSFERHQEFETRLREFLKVDISSKIIQYKKGILSYLTESVIPTKQDSRPPLLLLFGNPAPNSVQKKCFFADKKGKRQHPFWSVLQKAGIISFKDPIEDINTFRTRRLFDLDYESPFRIGLAVFYSMPSPASGTPWSGVAGLRKLFRAKTLRQITLDEKTRVENLVQEFIGSNPRGAVIAFQKDAYLSVKDDNSQESVVAKESKWCVVETSCYSSQIRLFKIPATRYMNANWYVDFLRQIRRLCLGE